eukprot:6625031-Prymnesium_polylepis.1
MSIFLGHFHRTAGFSLVPPVSQPQSTSFPGRLVHVFGRWLAPAASPHAASKTAISDGEKRLS